MKRRVRDVRRLITQEPTVVREDDSLITVSKKIIEDPKTRSVYVVNSDEKLVGIIPVMELIQYLYYSEIPQEYVLYRFPMILATEAKAKDIMLPPEFVRDDDELGEALRKMFKNNIKELPVVDEDMRIIGDLNILELILAWLESVENAD